ncbi:MAG: class I SAM-dependent methyltransferase [Parcubacteria group bacterium]|jgi:SAM-dependent methyltransferase
MSKINQDKMFADTAVMYDANANEYAKASRRELRELTLQPSLVKHLGDLSGKRVLDVGCGMGNSSRLALSCGARRVVGIDISEKEIITAREIDSYEPIKYLIRNAIDDLSDLGKFDLVTAILSVHYCTERAMLEKLFSNVKKVLKSGGEFLAVVVPFSDYDGYGVRISSPTGREGEPSNVSLSDFGGSKFLDFDDIYWSEKTYQEVLEKIGFSVEWLPCFVSNEGIRKYGENFWRKFLDDPIYKIFIAK